MPINPWLKEQIEKKGGSTLSVILEVPTSKLGYARNIISPIGNISSVSNIAGMSFITVSIDSSKISELSSIGTVHYNLPKGIKLCPLKQAKKSLIKIKDKFLGDVYISKVEIPTSPSRVIKDSISFKSENLIIIPSGKIVDKMKDTEESKSLSGRNVKLGVIDTGFVYGFTHPMIMYRYPELYTTIPELPVDSQAHGSFCTFMAGGSQFKHPVYGKMEGLAPNSDLVHIKALNSMGFGSSENTLKALEIAYNTGCKVVSVSLGGECQGGVDDDPEAKVIKSLSEKGMIIVSAAGNDSTDWSINAPAFSPYCISVGSWGFTDDKLSTFSSRGPQSIWYKTHQDEYQKDLNKYGQDLIKPDVCAYGGQINNKEEVIMTGGIGWFAPYYHKAIDGFSCMHGSSQATPQIAGVIACLVENDMIRNQSDFKKLLSYTLKSSEHGYGLVTFSKLTVPTESENDLPLEHHYTV